MRGFLMIDLVGFASGLEMEIPWSDCNFVFYFDCCCGLIHEKWYILDLTCVQRSFAWSKWWRWLASWIESGQISDQFEIYGYVLWAWSIKWWMEIHSSEICASSHQIVDSCLLFCLHWHAWLCCLSCCYWGMLWHLGSSGTSSYSFTHRPYYMYWIV